MQQQIQSEQSWMQSGWNIHNGYIFNVDQCTLRTVTDVDAEYRGIYRQDTDVDRACRKYQVMYRMGTVMNVVYIEYKGIQNIRTVMDVAQVKKNWYLQNGCSLGCKLCKSSIGMQVCVQYQKIFQILTPIVSASIKINFKNISGNAHTLERKNSISHNIIFYVNTDLDPIQCLHKLLIVVQNDEHPLNTEQPVLNNIYRLISFVPPDTACMVQDSNDP